MEEKKDYLDDIEDPYEFLAAVKKEMMAYNDQIDRLLSNKGPELRPGGEPPNRQLGHKERQKIFLQAEQEKRREVAINKFALKDPYSKVADAKDLAEKAQDSFFPNPQNPNSKPKEPFEEKDLENAQNSFLNQKSQFVERNMAKKAASKDEREL